jgi:hypothetical protein
LPQKRDRSSFIERTAPENACFPLKLAIASSRLEKANESNELRQSAVGFDLETDDDVTYGFVA